MTLADDRAPFAPDPFLLDPSQVGLATDLYQLTMMAAYRARNLSGQSVFELFVRRLPASRGFLVTAGLEQALAYLRALRFTEDDVAWLRQLPVFASVEPGFFDWLKGFRFTGSVDAIPEGTVTFPNEPLLATINMQTLIASKAARVRIAAGPRTVVDFGARRAHGFGAAMLATRACWIAGVDGTSNVIAARRLGVPVMGTAAHAFIMSFEREQEAFEAYHRLYPDHCVLLIDTYDTLQGCRRAAAIGPALKGVRLDSGDLGELAKGCRAILDGEGLQRTRIVASGDLNEDKIAELIATGAPIDSFGVGTELVTSRDQPSLGGVYKLVERHEDGRRIPVMKLASGKVTWPGSKQVWRLQDADGQLVRDVIELADADPPPAPDGGRAEPLLVPVIRDGELVAGEDVLGVAAARARCERSMASLPEPLRSLHDFPLPPTENGPALQQMADTLRARRSSEEQAGAVVHPAE